MRRAMRDEQKEERRQVILDAAWQLFQSNPYETVNISDVARDAGLAKGTVYLYFKTKEELFLVVQEQQFRRWFDEIDAQLQALENDGTIPTVAALMTDSLSQRSTLMRLFAIVHVILEQNVEYKAILRFKHMLLERLLRTGALLETCLPGLGPGQGARLLLRAYALVIGLQHLADPAPLVRQALQNEPDLAIFKIDFAGEFLATLIDLLKGLLIPEGDETNEQPTV